jgi:putative CRISPR-associated protein (TIGR02620 family)
MNKIKKVIVTRHAAVVAWLEKNGVIGDVIDHVSDVSEIKGCHVYGILPTHLQAETACITLVEIPRLPQGRRGDELSIDEMEEFGARLVTYSPPRVVPTTPPNTNWGEGSEKIHPYTIHPSTFDEEGLETWYVLVDHVIGEIFLIGGVDKLRAIYEDARNALDGVLRETITEYHPWNDWMVEKAAATQLLIDGGFPEATAPLWLERAVTEIKKAPQWGERFHVREVTAWCRRKMASEIGLEGAEEIANTYEKYAKMEVRRVREAIVRRVKSSRYGVGVDIRTTPILFKDALSMIDSASRWGNGDLDNKRI